MSTDFRIKREKKIDNDLNEKKQVIYNMVICAWF